MSEQATNLQHWLNVDWIKEQSTLSDNQGLPFLNRWVCLLNAPSTTQTTRNGWLELQVLAAECPNFGIEPTELELNGARRFVFKGRNDSELSITFLDTPDLLLRRFFYAWMNMAITISQEVGVKRDYMKNYMPNPCEFMLFPLDYAGNGRYCDRFTHVFPYDISGISYNYAQAGEVLKTTVRFKYMYHSITSLKDSKPYHVSENGGSSSIPDMSSEWLDRKYNKPA
jgi:hypothetical protein